MELGCLLFLAVPLLVLVVGLALTGVAFGASALMFKVFGRISHQEELAARYPAARPPEGHLHRRQWMAVGPVYHRYSADVRIGARGLCFRARPFLAQYEPVMIPWPELRDPRGAILYGQPAARLTVGDPGVNREAVPGDEAVSPLFGIGPPACDIGASHLVLHKGNRI